MLTTVTSENQQRHQSEPNKHMDRDAVDAPEPKQHNANTGIKVGRTNLRSRLMIPRIAGKTPLSRVSVLPDSFFYRPTNRAFTISTSTA